MVTQVKEPIIRLKDQNKPIREITLGVAKSVICDSSFPQLKKIPHTASRQVHSSLEEAGVSVLFNSTV